MDSPVKQGVDNDESKLRSLGVKPELKRTYNFWSCKSFLMTQVIDKAEPVPYSDGVSNDNSVLMELQHCHVLLHIHTRRPCLSSLGNVSAHKFIPMRRWAISNLNEMYSVVVTLGQLLVMASLAEYCSLWPTAGGQQFYTQVNLPGSGND